MVRGDGRQRRLLRARPVDGRGAASSSHESARHLRRGRRRRAAGARAALQPDPARDPARRRESRRRYRRGARRLGIFRGGDRGFAPSRRHSLTIPEGVPTMDIVKIGPGFGAELRGVSLEDVAARKEVYDAVRAAFEEHSIILLRGQKVSDENQLAFSRSFGPLETVKVASLGEGTPFSILKNFDETGKVVPETDRLALRQKANQLWHTDSTFKKIPALASVLSARIIPPSGGETEFASTRLAWARLPAEARARFERSFAWHDYAY